MSEPGLPYWVDHDTIMIPATALADGGETIGDGALPITAENPAFAQWVEWMSVSGIDRPQPQP